MIRLKRYSHRVWIIVFLSFCVILYAFTGKTAKSLRPLSKQDFKTTRTTEAIHGEHEDRFLDKNPNLPTPLQTREVDAPQSKGSEVLLVSYQRSGSSFLGNVIGRREDAFFWFEPLNKGREWSYLTGNNSLCDMRKTSCIQVQSSDLRSKEAGLQVIDDIFKCNLTRPMTTLTYISFYPEIHAPYWDPFKNCLKERKAGYYSPECIKYLEQPCIAKHHRVTKVLRISLDIAAELLETNPRLKIVHLFRDPRAVMNSHLNTAWYSRWLRSRFEVEEDVKVLCSRMEEDIVTGRTLMAKYPNKVKVVQYEDFSDLTEKVEKIYDFLKMDFSEKYQLFVSNLVKPSKDGRAGFHPDGHRQKLPWYVVEIVNSHCSNVYKLLGLREFKTENEYRNQNLSIIGTDILPFRIT